MKVTMPVLLHGSRELSRMHMEVEYRLSCCLAVVLYQVEAIRMKRFRHGCCHFFAENHCFRCGFIRNFINVCKMLLWKQGTLEDAVKEQIIESVTAELKA